MINQCVTNFVTIDVTSSGLSCQQKSFHSCNMTMFKQIRADKKITQEALAEAVDTARGTINRLESGKMNMTRKWAERLAPHLGVTPAQLIFEPDELRKSIDLNVRLISVKGHVQAGAWTESFEWSEDDFYDVAVPKVPELEGVNLYGAETRGPSMNRIYQEGTILVFSDIIETGDVVESGKRYIIEREKPGGEREVTVKQAYIDEKGELWMVPSSDDPRFQTPLNLNGEDGENITIKGRVRFSVNRE